MTKNRLLFFVAAALASSAVTLWAQGAKVEAKLHDGRAVRGELYAVRDSAIIIVPEAGAIPDEFGAVIPGCSYVKTRLVRQVIVDPGNTVLKSMGIGALIGGGVGALLGVASGDDPQGSFLKLTAGEKAAIGGIALGAGGLVVGLVVGVVQSSKQRIVEPLEGWDLSVLKPVSRYPVGEPGPAKNIP